jgi:hypothetical protein
MRKIILFIVALFAFNLQSLFAQEIPEPEFIGETLLIKSDNSVISLDKSTSQGRTVASTGLMLTGFGKVRNQIQIDGCCSSVKINKNDDIKFIIRNVDNLTDPMSIISIFKFEIKKKFRRAELSATNSFGSSKSNNLEYLSFSGKKYGDSSYLIKLDDKEVGEYGIIISNPNNLDQKRMIVTSFSIVE